VAPERVFPSAIVELYMSIQVALVVITGLSFVSLGIIVAFTLSMRLREALPFYDPVADWVGHGIPDVGMVYMAAVMAGLISPIVPFSWCVTFFAASAGVFLVRIATNTCFVWWQDILHFVGVIFKAYMFVSVVYWQEFVTAHAIVYFVGVIFLYVHRTYASMQDASGITFGRLLFNAEHISMSIAAILMFAMMQWPTSFPLAGTLMCQDPAITRSHKH